MTDHEKRIREALDAGPTEGPWASEVDDTNPNELNIISNNRPYVATAWPADASNDREQEANAAFIAACNPSAIRALLADLDAMRGALKSVQAAIYMDDAGQLRLTRSFDESTIDAALKGASHE